MKRYEFKDHTADVIAKGYGSTLEEAFAAAGEAMFNIITGGADVACVEDVEFETESIDLEGLLVGFLSHLIVVHEVDELVLAELSVEFVGANRLRAHGPGEKFEHSRHGNGVQVKGVSYHLIEINPDDGEKPAEVQVLFDI